jgi:hypothetical protein
MNLHIRLPSFLSVAVVAVAACSSAPGKKEPPQQPMTPPKDSLVVTPTVKIAVASATIGYDCQNQDPQIAAAAPAKSASPGASQPKPPAAGKRAPILGDAPLSAGDMPDDVMRQGSRAPMVCEQTAIQLQITTVGAPTTAALRNVELLDDQGKVLGKLTPRLPLKWDDSISEYKPWDLSVAADTSANVRWTLSTPVWTELGMTRSEAANRVFRIRVTVGATGGDQVADGEARVVVISPPTPLPPGAVT